MKVKKDLKQMQSASNSVNNKGNVRNEIINNKLSTIRQMLFVAFVSAVLFGNEVLLTRYFSTVITVNMVYLVVSSALFGTGIGAYIAHGYLKNNDISITQSFVRKSLLLLALSLSFFWGIALVGPYIESLSFYIIASSLAFVFGGMIMSAIYMQESKIGHEMYFADMFGAVIGCAIVVLAMIQYEFYTGLAIIFLLVALSLLINNYVGGKRLKYMVVGIMIIISASLLSDSFLENMSDKFNAYYKNPNKGVSYIAEAYKSDVEIIYSNWGAFSRTDVLKLIDDDSARYILTDGGASAPIIKFDGDLSKHENMKKDISYLPYLVGRNDKSLLIGSGGGKDVLYALLSGSESITAVEINEGTIDAVTDSKEYSGDIYNQIGVDLVVGDGRKFVDETNETFDHIYLSMLMSNAIDNSRLSLVENYIFTEEAFSSYMNVMKPEGRISFKVHNGIEAIRVANTWIKTLINQGVPESQVNDYFVIINGMKNNGDQMSPVHMPSVILKKTPFNEAELSIINDFRMSENVVVMHLPTIPNDFYLGLSDGTMSYEEVIQQLEVNVKPVKDANPFFYKYSTGMPKDLIPLIILTFSIGVFLIFRLKREKVSLYHTTYYIAIGIGYIVVELGYIQSLQRYLEKPIYSFTLVLVGMLAGSAIGALGSTKINFLKRIRVYAPVIAGILVLVGYYWLSIMIPQTIMFSIGEKLKMVLPIILSVGFFMGMPFPYMVERMGSDKLTKNQIPLMYALNGYASILGSIMALVVAMNLGFSLVVITGAFVYAGLGVVNLRVG